MNGFERRKERKKESIRRAALELFQEHGFKKVSMDDIARRAGVSHVTIYNHFTSKEDLVRDVVKSLLTSMLDTYRGVIEGDRPFLEKLEIVVLDKTQVVSKFQGELVQTVLHSDPEIQQFVESLWERDIKQLMLELFDEGKREEFINPDISQESILAYFEILRRGFAASGIPSLETGQDGKLIRDLMSLIVYGLNG